MRAKFQVDPRGTENRAARIELEAGGDVLDPAPAPLVMAILNIRPRSIDVLLLTIHAARIKKSSLLMLEI